MSTISTSVCDPKIPDDRALGGCSGAPLLTFADQRGGFSWRVGGNIYE
jgi:hypothetical protein